MNNVEMSPELYHAMVNSGIEDPEEYLAHYGVKGMQWGVRKVEGDGVGVKLRNAATAPLRVGFRNLERGIAMNKAAGKAVVRGAKTYGNTTVSGAKKAIDLNVRANKAVSDFLIKGAKTYGKTTVSGAKKAIDLNVRANKAVSDVVIKGAKNAVGGFDRLAEGASRLDARVALASQKGAKKALDFNRRANEAVSDTITKGAKAYGSAVSARYKRKAEKFKSAISDVKGRLKANKAASEKLTKAYSAAVSNRDFNSSSKTTNLRRASGAVSVASVASTGVGFALLRRSPKLAVGAAAVGMALGVTSSVIEDARIKSQNEDVLRKYGK